MSNYYDISSLLTPKELCKAIALPTYAKKVKYISKIYDKKKLLEDVKPLEKSESKSAEIRQKANSLFTSKQFMPAMEAYNEALCWAPPGSDSVGILYANRSAIYLHTGFYKFCLENIQLALENAYPERLKSKLLQRKDECLQKMQTQKDSMDVYGLPMEIKLSYTANPQNPNIIDGVECVKNEEFGRHLVTKRDLKAGDVVLVDPEPFVKTVLPPNVYTHCYNCTGHNFFNLKPCPRSTKVMFCSETCATEAWEKFYQYELPLLDHPIRFQYDVAACAIRAALKAFTMVEDPEELKELVKSIDVESENGFKLNQMQASEREKFRVFYSMVTNEAKLTDIKKYMLLAAVTGPFTILKTSEAFQSLVGNHLDFFLELAVRFTFISNSNGFRISNKCIYDGASEVKSHGSGICLLKNLLNHSCNPNVCTLDTGKRGTVVFTLRPIKAGEQIFTSYGKNIFHSVPRVIRQDHLKNKYCFDCKCDACLMDYPMEDSRENYITENLSTYRQIEAAIYDPYGAASTQQLEKRIRNIFKKYHNKLSQTEMMTLQEGVLVCKIFSIYKKPLNFIFSA